MISLTSSQSNSKRKIIGPPWKMRELTAPNFFPWPKNEMFSSRPTSSSPRQFRLNKIVLRFCNEAMKLSRKSVRRWRRTARLNKSSICSWLLSWSQSWKRCKTCRPWLRTLKLITARWISRFQTNIFWFKNTSLWSKNWSNNLLRWKRKEIWCEPMCTISVEI